MVKLNFKMLLLASLLAQTPVLCSDSSTRLSFTPPSCTTEETKMEDLQEEPFGPNTEETKIEFQEEPFNSNTFDFLRGIIEGTLSMHSTERASDQSFSDKETIIPSVLKQLQILRMPFQDLQFESLPISKTDTIEQSLIQRRFVKSQQEKIKLDYEELITYIAGQINPTNPEDQRIPVQILNALSWGFVNGWTNKKKMHELAHAHKNFYQYILEYTLENYFKAEISINALLSLLSIKDNKKQPLDIGRLLYDAALKKNIAKEISLKQYEDFLFQEEFQPYLASIQQHREPFYKFFFEAWKEKLTSYEQLRLFSRALNAKDTKTFYAELINNPSEIPFFCYELIKENDKCDVYIPSVFTALKEKNSEEHNKSSDEFIFLVESYNEQEKPEKALREKLESIIATVLGRPHYALNTPS